MKFLILLSVLVAATVGDLLFANGEHVRSIVYNTHVTLSGLSSDIEDRWARMMS